MESTSKVSLKLLIDREGERVLFAEAGKDFVDFLFQIFCLPLGSVVSLLSKEHMVGCLGKLYSSIENLNNTYMQPCASKNDLLNPKPLTCASNAPLLLLRDSTSSKKKGLYTCSKVIASSYSTTTASIASLNYSRPCNEYVTDDPQAICPKCNVKLNRELTYVPAANGKAATQTNEGGYVKGLVTYMIMDDLEVKPMSTISSIALLNKFNIKDLGAVEEKEVDLGIDEALKLLKASLCSDAVLTDVFLGKKLIVE